MNYSFDEKIDRFSTPAAKFHREYLKEIFGTDDLYPFWVADEDFKTPPEIINAFIEKCDIGNFGYEYKPQSFFPIVQSWFKDRYNVNVNPDWIQFTPTIMTSMAMALDLFTNEGEGVIIQPPVYMEFSNTISKTKRKVVENNLQLVDLHYEINFNELNKLASEQKTTTLCICNPHNPGGRVWTKKELQQIVDICIANNLLLISDEIHADIIFSNGEFTSLLSFPEIHNKLIVCYSPAKVFNIASITDSMAIIPNDDLREKFNDLRIRYNLGRTYAFSRIAMEVGFSKSREWVNQLNEYIESNLLFISEYLKINIPKIQMVKQEGTYLVWLKVDNLPIKGNDLVKYLAKEAKMGLNNGANFGSTGEGFLRMNISCPKSIIEESMIRLKNAIEKIS